MVLKLVTLNNMAKLNMPPSLLPGRVFINFLSGDSEFQAEALQTTNAFRKTHSVQPMRLSAELCHQATEYAKKIAGLGSLQHDFDTVRQLDEGENLAMGCKQYGVPLTAKEAITNW